MRQYLDLLQHIIDHGDDKSDRTGTGTRSIFGYQMRFNLADGFPALTTKKIWMKGVIHELLWMLSGSTNVKPLQNVGVKIWDEWADKDGELGPVYGDMWRNFPHYEWDGLEGGPVYTDQIKDVLHQISVDPNSRRLIVTAWHPGLVEECGLPPCHMMFQFHIVNDRLSCHMYQRSADVFLGVPFNIASYALLTMMVAQVCGLVAGDFIHTFGDVHIYNNHKEQVEEQLGRKSRTLPRMWINPAVESIFDFTYADFRLDGYAPHPVIKADVSV